MHQIARRIALSPRFDAFIIAVIVLTAILVGLEAFPSLMTTERLAVFNYIHKVVLLVFIVEAAIKILAHGKQPWRYFQDGWNVFDFSLIVLSLLPVTGDFALMGRVLRLLRVMRLVNALPELRLIVETLLHSIPSMFHIMLLMSVLFFIYAVLGYHLFSEHDPEHWRNLGYAVLTLFRIVTLEDWTDVMYKAMEMSPFYGLYFVSFVVFGTFVVINLFIAVVINNLDESKYAHLKKLQQPDVHSQLILTLKETRQNIELLEKQITEMRNQLPNQFSKK